MPPRVSPQEAKKSPDAEGYSYIRIIFVRIHSVPLFDKRSLTPFFEIGKPFCKKKKVFLIDPARDGQIAQEGA